ncbi:MAG: nuclear transport factor 2 family protein, partial [Chloroflexota bacterium]
LLVPIEKVARFIETGDESLLSAFAKQGVVIIENFAPHLFEGEDAVKRWSQKILSWHRPPSDLVLKHKFGTPQDISIHDDLAFLSLPTHWTISENGSKFEEDGGWAFVLVREDGEWRVRSYGWAVTLIED